MGRRENIHGLKEAIFFLNRANAMGLPLYDFSDCTKQEVAQILKQKSPTYIAQIRQIKNNVASDYELSQRVDSGYSLQDIEREIIRKNIIPSRVLCYKLLDLCFDSEEATELIERYGIQKHIGLYRHPIFSLDNLERVERDYE